MKRTKTTPVNVVPLLREDPPGDGRDDSLVESNFSEDTDSDPIPEIEREIHESDDNDTRLKFFLSNARSLAPKITSLIDFMFELSSDFAIITETWFRGGRQLQAELSDIEQASGIKLVCKNRPVRGGAGGGGGVAVAFNTARCNLKRKNIKSSFEVLCVAGKIAKISRQVAIFAIYIPPKTKSAEFARLCEEVATAILDLNTSLHNPGIIIGGDFNNRDPKAMFEAADGFMQVPSAPTRGTATLDLIFTNTPDALVSDRAEIYPPLESESGLSSDHCCVWTSLKFKKERDFKWIKVSVRLRSDKRNEAFRKGLSEVDWGPMEHMEVDDAVRTFENTIQSLTDEHFPVRSFRRRSNEDPWITNAIRRKSKKKKRLFRESGRSPAWRALSSELEKEVRDSKESFVDDAVAKGGNGRNFYSAVKKLSGPGAPGEWSVRELFPGRPDGEVCGEVIDYFSSVGGRERGAPMPAVHHSPLGLHFSPEDILKRLRDMKKKDSYVSGDPLPHVMRLMPELFAKPVATIFNKACDSSIWPANWKTEYITVIPKVKNPSSLSETRNISCTALLSKVLEGALLEQLRDELQPDASQYGGLKACGAEHMLVDLWESALEALENGTDAVLMLGIDFQKAFNRMEYSVCMEQLEKLGASPGSLSMVRSFLSNRKMTMKLGTDQSALVEIIRGSPQGSVLGCMLYCATTQSLLSEQHHTIPAPEVGTSPRPARGLSSFDSPPLPRIPAARGDRLRFFPTSGSESSEDDVCFWGDDGKGDSPIAEDSGGGGEKDLG